MTDAPKDPTPSFDHSKLTRRAWIPGVGGCVCSDCKKLPDYDPPTAFSATAGSNATSAPTILRDASRWRAVERWLATGGANCDVVIKRRGIAEHGHPPYAISIEPCEGLTYEPDLDGLRAWGGETLDGVADAMVNTVYPAHYPLT